MPENPVKPSSFYIEKHQTVHSSSPAYYLGKLVWAVARFVLMLSLAFIILYPVLFMLSMAFRQEVDVYDPTIVWVPKHLTLDNFRDVDKVVHFFTALKNTLVLTVFSSVLQVFTCALAGYGFARFRFKFKGLLFGAMIFTIVVPSQMVSLPNYILFKDVDFFGIIQAIKGAPSGITLLETPACFFVLAAFGMGIRSGIFILIFQQFFRGMPVELEDAALVDGCGNLKTYFRIMLPNAKTVILVCFLFSFVWYWNDYYLTSIYCASFTTLSTALANLQTGLQQILGNGANAWDQYQIVTIQQACCLLTILPLVVIYVFTQKYFIQSVERTGIVG